MSRSAARWCAWIPVSLALLAGVGGALRASEPMSAHTAKAAFLVNFVKFAEWPAQALPSGAPLVLCVADDGNVAAALERSTEGREAGGHALMVRRIDVDGAVRACHLLYAGGLDATRSSALIARAQGAPLLTVSDYPRFSQLGGVAHLFLDGGRMRFAVNVDAAARSGLRLSSRLLSLAVLVKDDSDASRP